MEVQDREVEDGVMGLQTVSHSVRAPDEASVCIPALTHAKIKIALQLFEGSCEVTTGQCIHVSEKMCLRNTSGH